MKKNRYIAFLITVLLLLCGMTNEVWAAKVTYHILTLPFTTYNDDGTPYKSDIRVEALRVIVDNGTQVELPAHFKSPLAENFTYWASDTVTKSTNAEKLYPHNGTSAFTYTFTGSTPIPAGTAVTKNCDIYVTYTYKTDNTVAKLDGSKTYNIYIRGGFLAYNRGRNNRPAVVPEKYVTTGQLANEDFVKVDLTDGKSGITTYWSSGDNKNPKAEVESQFNFLFTYEGSDPYNITIRSKYGNETACFVEKNIDDSKFVNKYYKGAALYAHQNDNIFLSSDQHKKYTFQNQDVSVKTVESTPRNGYFHGLTNPIWGSFAILDNSDNSGYVFIATRTVTDKGAINDPSKTGIYYKYNYLTNTNSDNNQYNNNLTIKSMTTADANNYSTSKEMYEIETIHFKVVTPFGNECVDSIKLSQFFIHEKQQLIDPKDIPSALNRKYCTFKTKFYKSSTFTPENEITKYSQATQDEGETYTVYLGYEVSASIPFKAIKPADSYTKATWYELTDEGSTQEYGRKIKYDNSAKVYKNNGANGEYEKTTEFAFVGDPYELKVIYRDSTEEKSANYYVALSGHESWDIPVDAIDGTFLLRKFNDTGYWKWDAVQPSGAVVYQSNLAYSAGKDAQTITFNVSGLTVNKYIKVTPGGTDASQIVSVTPSPTYVLPVTATSATVTMKLQANTDLEAAKTVTLTIQEYNDDEGTSEFGTASVITITQGTSSSSFTPSTVEYSTSGFTRVKVLELIKRKFTYYIVDKAGNIAARATELQPIYSSLSVLSIPEIIRSPFILDETITFYTTYTGGGRGNLSSPITQLSEGDPNRPTKIYVKYTTAKREQKPIKLSEDQEFNVKLNGQYIYYDQTEHVLKTNATPNPADLSLTSYLWELRNRDPYAMLVDNLGAREVLPLDEETKVAGRTETVTVYDDNGVSSSATRQMGAWVHLASIENEGALTITTDRADAQRFIAKSSTSSGIYEVMVATNTVDADTTYYNIGCPETNSVKIYNNATYEHGDNELKFILNQNIDFVYHLIDNAHHELLTTENSNLELILPEEYQSPLVGTYNYYALDQMNIVGDEYTPINPASKLSSISDLFAKYTTTPIDKATYDSQSTKLEAANPADMDSKVRVYTQTGYYYYHIVSNDSYVQVHVTDTYRGNQIYVTYEKNDLVNFNDKGSPYMLRFLNPYASGYHLEDGNDKLTATKYQAVYPYCNGDGCLNVYSTDANEVQMSGGASTRPRWIWYFESEHNDPYHVKIHSNSTISYNGVSHPTYLQTYVVHFNQDTEEYADRKHVVTGGVLAGVASVEPTEYMILGTEGHYKLLTTYPITETVANGLSDKDKRQYVVSLEQYWKTYNMLKLHVLGISKSTDAFSNDESTWVVPESQRTTLNTVLESMGVGSGNWHSYAAIANAVRWNGFNDKTDGHEKKVVENLEHWFQTFEMGDGTFAIESAVIPPVLVLLDLHGWEIMRKPLPTTTYPYGDELEALRAYDSPLVDKYYFYSNATKATGCHKYSLRMQNGAERDQIKVDGERYSSTSLGDLPPLRATGVKDGNGIFNDQFVIYTVKEEYENSYRYHLELHEEDSTFTESGTPMKYLLLQNARYIRKVDNDLNTSYISKPIHEASNVPNAAGTVYDMILAPSTTDYDATRIAPDHNQDGKIDDVHLWYVGPNLNIDEEMGIKWAEMPGGSGEPLTEYETKKAYKDKTGFDPYNMQFKNAGLDNRYLTTHTTTTSLSQGAMLGAYPDGNTNVTLGPAFTDYRPTVDKGSEGYDHTFLQMSNQTFMAVSDANGNMQLMPRFDHSKRVNTAGVNPWHTTLDDPENQMKAKVDDNSSMGSQTSFLVHPQVIEYHIIDHNGNEALSYKRAGDYSPAITEHFMSPLATDYKYYFNHAAYTASAISRASYEAAATSAYFKKEAATAEAMATAAKAFTVRDDYYFRVGAGTEESPYTYKKVTVTSAHSGSTDATYTTADCTEAEWTNAVAYQRTAAGEAAMETAVLSLAAKGLYYYQLGNVHYAYKKVVRSGGQNTITISSEGEYTGTLTAIDAEDFEAKVNALSVDDTYYYKVGPLYDYRKVVVTHESTDFGADVAAKVDISDKQITGSFADAGLDGDAIQVYVRYRYWQEADVDQRRILQGKWFTIQLANKDVLATGEFDTYAKTATNSSDYETQKAALSTDGDYYFRIGTSSYTYKKVTKSGSDPLAEIESDTTAWANALGTGVLIKQGTDKPTPTVDGSDDNLKWQWKLLAAPMDPESEYYVEPDPYAIEIYNREKNYSASLSQDPNPMGVPIKINGANHFALLSHPEGDYAFAVQGSGYTYTFLNGASMTTSVAATTAAESTNESDTYHFTIKSNALSSGARVELNDDVIHTYTYSVITNDTSGNKIAVVGTQDNESAKSHGYTPFLPDEVQSPLLNTTDYTYYGNVTLVSDSVKVVPETQLHTLYGLYRDSVYVRYGAYDVNQTKYKVPNKRNATETGQVARDAGSKDAVLNITGRLPYNIIWYSDNMMQSEDNSTISDGESHTLSGGDAYAWQFEGADPYSLKIKHRTSKKYVNNSSGTDCTLESTATPFMLLKGDDFEYGEDYGVLAVTEHQDKKLSGHGNTLVIDDHDPETHEDEPKKFIIFGLSVNELIYHLVICPTNTYTPIPYRPTELGTEHATTASWLETDTIRIEGSTQRDLETAVSGVPGDKYQLGTTVNINDGSTTTAYTYNYDAGAVSLGDVLDVPTEFYRPNCTFEFYVDGIYDDFTIGTQTLSNPNETLNNLYKGVKLDSLAPRLMSDERLINKTIRVNIVYSFDKSLATNSGLDFVRNVSDNLWYTFETYNAATPYLAHYTNAWGLQAMEGAETRYTNDYLWTPLGDPYGFRMYNRYMIKNSGASNYVMTTDNTSFIEDVEGTKLKMAVPGETNKGNEVYELLAGNAEGYFRIHPVINTKDQTQYYVRRYDNTAVPDFDEDGKSDLDYTILSTTPCDWTFGLDMTLLEPYYLQAGYIGGLTTTPKKPELEPKSGKELYEDALKVNIMQIQKVVYNDDNIVDFTPGYYRLHSMPGTPGISTIRYASGYLHDAELSGDDVYHHDSIPMHFYSRKGTSTTFETLKKGFTETTATRGDIPVVPTENDPSTIFWLDGGINPADEDDGVNPRVIMSTQGLYVRGKAANADRGDAIMTDSEEGATRFSLIGIGGAVFLITDKLDPATRNYLHYSQDYVVDEDNKIYDLKFFHNSPTNEARWCIEPANNQGLKVATNNGGDDYYYTTFYAPYDVLLPDDAKGKTYNAYICKKWYDEGVNPSLVPADGVYPEGKFVPAGTPVIIRAKDESGSMTLTLPSASPSSSLPGIFSGQYLEQKLSATNVVYTFGLPFVSTVTMDHSTGDITAEVPSQAKSGVGFYINANPNKEHNSQEAMWLRNNRYVLHNKIYYQEGSSGAHAPENKNEVQYVPVNFDGVDEEQPGEEEPGENQTQQRVGDGCAYDIVGRKVASEAAVKNGTWYQGLTPGIYIVDGQKIYVGY